MTFQTLQALKDAKPAHVEQVPSTSEHLIYNVTYADGTTGEIAVPSMEVEAFDATISTGFSGNLEDYASFNLVVM